MQFGLIGAELAFGDLPLLDRAHLSVLAGERIALVGRNGAGKSSLLAVLGRERALDAGEARWREGLRVVRVEQEPVLPRAATLRESLALRGALARMPDERDRWRAESRLDAELERLEMDGAVDPQRLSGGELKRGALALALALEPELLLLDEPTNHLDIAAIERLEERLIKGPTLVFITHDRHFLDRVCTRIVELDRGELRSYPGRFSDYQRIRAEELSAEAAASRRFDRFWQQEEVWIRKGVEARRTRNEGRVRRLQALRQAREARRERLGTVRLAVDSGERSGRRVIELTEVHKAFGERTVVRGLSMTVMRGDRLGLVGPNGIGKSTLLRLILGQIAPDSGRIEQGTQLQIAYFDQLREQLDPDRSVAETISPGSDWVEVGGQRKHVIGYLGDFLFSPRRAQSPVRTLSGGERNRLLLARLFARPANLLVLDEPTNDLDLESIELLEETLQGYDGTLLLVSHDRAFLDNVVTQVLVAEGDGEWRETVGGYSDWLRQRAQSGPVHGSSRPAITGVAAQGMPTATGSQAAFAPGASSASAAGAAHPDGALASALPPVRRKLSYKEQRELESLPGLIAGLEAEQAQLQAAMGEPDYYRRDARDLRRDQDRIESIESELLVLLERWENLESLSTSK